MNLKWLVVLVAALAVTGPATPLLSEAGQEGRGDMEEQLLQAVAAQPDSFETHQSLARLYLLQQRREDALRQLRKAAALGPLDRDLALQRATLEIAAGNRAEGERELRRLVDELQSVQAGLYLARLLSENRNPEEAMEVLRRTRELAPNSEEVLRALARTSLETGAPVSAILALEPLIRMHPGEVEYSYLMGVARLQVADWAGAAEAFEAARELQPQSTLTLIGLGLALNGQKRFGEARDVLMESVRLTPDNVEGLAALAEAEEGLARYAEAERHALAALEEDPSHATAHLVLGMVRMQQGRVSEAREALEQAVANDPESPKAHYQLSLAYARLGDPERSRHHLDLYRTAREKSERQFAQSAGDDDP